jgi:hypothetical protein
MAGGMAAGHLSGQVLPPKPQSPCVSHEQVVIIHENGATADVRLDTPSWYYPSALESQNLCGRFEVSVIVDNGELVCGGEGR